ncbi:pantoate--beta-alanine ligase [Saccharicrinis fermentans]|uniref:Pantothenate synthetase n=1 Tax=Saccharicrinis fermentans DSM 9555 = JCM 21142 TaxID=869213 RepID=W7YM14_9BACT|nr:pantoate--beta-alanine ligase [Saccharicrinis fermentans]GAF03439.1 pantothenate synthetase [Saccharicrinis fermentans DSM 9555 = JCM 21142]
MNIVTNSEELKSLISAHKDSGQKIGFVPTMGALHKGHLSLVETAGQCTDVVVVSIFVNPNQFNNQEDLLNYPRTIDHDKALLSSTACTILYHPTVEDVYPQEDNRVFDFGMLDKVMEGKFRPGHFNGVAQVVSRFFDLVQPHKAFFGEKDFQQLAVIKAMTKMLNYEIEIVPVKIVREKDGLAMSSRNERLSEEQRRESVLISKTLFESKQQMDTKNIKEVINFVVDKINSSALLNIEYFNIVDGDTLQPVDDWNESEYIVGCIAVFADKVRLIDNLIYKNFQDVR